MSGWKGWTGAMAAALVVLAPLAAAADEAVATTHLNVRTGPGPGFDRVDTLFPGEVVDMTECQANGWCFISHDGPDGWVSSRYLTGPDRSGPLAGDCRFELRITSDGPEFAIVCGDGTLPAGDDDGGDAVVPTGHQACFYDLPNFEGESFCRGVTTLNTLPPAADNRITSVRLSGDARVRLCQEPNLDDGAGFCRNVMSSEGQLGGLLDNQVSSLQVFTGTPPGVVPPVLSTGTVSIPNTRRLNLDTGALGMAGADLWYRVNSPTVPRLATTNGARIATPPGPVNTYDDCIGVTYAPGPLRMADFAPGSVICVQTSDGHTSLVRRDGATPANITLSYRTFND